MADTEITIEEIGLGDLDRYATVPISFAVESELRVEEVDGGMGGLRLTEEPVEAPYVKDYDAAEGEGPTRWSQWKGLESWSFWLAVEDGEPVGAAAVAFDTPGIHMLEGRRDLAVLWDLRIRPDRRRSGLGRRLFERAADWARGRGCRQFKVETQNVNVPACRFYAAKGRTLGAVHRHAYAASPAEAHETMLLWYLDLTA